MKLFLNTSLVLMCFSIWAQKPCDFSTNVVDSIGRYKTTKEYLLHEKNFGGNTTFLFASFITTDDNALLNIQLIEKSDGFIKAKCLDKNSKLYLQLMNNRIVTLSLDGAESCGALLRDNQGKNNRILSGYFSIKQVDYKDLKSSAVTFIRIKYAGETADYVLRKEFTSELNGDKYYPESYFIDFLHCAEVTKS